MCAETLCGVQRLAVLRGSTSKLSRSIRSSTPAPSSTFSVHCAPHSAILPACQLGPAGAPFHSA
jgi:hypothetical protein